MADVNDILGLTVEEAHMVDPVILGELLARVITHGFKENYITAGSFKVFSTADNPLEETWQDLVLDGTKPGNAMIFIALISGADASADYLRSFIGDYDDVEELGGTGDVAHSLKVTIYVALFELFRSSKPHHPVPKFITTTLDWHDDPTTMWSFFTDLGHHQFNPQWVKTIDFKVLGTKLFNRLQKGFKTIRGLSAIAAAVRELPSEPRRNRVLPVLEKLLSFAANWDYHGSTRSPAVQGYFPNLNASLYHLAHTLLGEDAVREMKAKKYFAMEAVLDHGANDWMNWDAIQVPVPIDFIFPRQ